MRQGLRSKREVFHFFANKLQESGESGNVFFSNGILYSYGRHFKIAEHRDGFTLITERKYSNSTAKQVSQARQAMSHLNLISVPNLDDMGKFYSDRELEVRKALASFTRARTNKGYYIKEVNDLLLNIDQYSAATGTEIPGEMKGFLSQVRLNMESMAADCAVFEAKLKAAESARIEKALKGWLSFDPDFTTGMLRGEYSWVRFNANMDRFETSQDVNIDRMEGLEFWKRLRLGMIRKGDKIGYYTVISDSEKVLKIGCHKMKVAHLLEIGEKVFGV